ncbi:MAG: MerR family transcriptional regulator [Candidatus Neomarinimicrobiota bacterium]|nr:MerR family transcriptional regulator [Candidatus Neomarinimicrobiota bacterium]
MHESDSKLYYSIKEVSELTELKPYVLRYWETEFPSLNPSKNRAGNRIYKKNDISMILNIKELLYKKKFTIKGAIEELKRSSNEDMRARKVQDGDKSILEEVRNELRSILNELNRH